MSTVSIAKSIGSVQECLNATSRRCTVPAFSFEKISPPDRNAPLPPVEAKPRGVIFQMLDRWAEARTRRMLKQDKAAPVSDPAAPEQKR
jgi:hypothetical protein